MRSWNKLGYKWASFSSDVYFFPDWVVKVFFTLEKSKALNS